VLFSPGSDNRHGHVKPCIVGNVESAVLVAGEGHLDLRLATLSAREWVLCEQVE